MERFDEKMPFLLRYENVAWYENGEVKILDRRVYPREVRFETCKSYREVVVAIQNLVTQSAGPYTAVGMGMALACFESKDLKKDDRIKFLEKAEYSLANSRITTASRYGKITKRCLEIAKKCIEKDEDPIKPIVEDTIKSLNRRYSTMQLVGDSLLELIPENKTLLTQCYGETIVGCLIVAAKKQNKNFKVICAETRPFLQGARLTASCFAEEGFDTTVVTDNMIADIMRKGLVDVFSSAADTITEDGSVVNKVGTFQIALLAKHFNIPYYVTGIPDLGKKTLDDVKIEMRNPEDVLKLGNVKHTQKNVKGYYPSFDATPSDFVSKIVTDHGAFSPKDLKKYFEFEKKDFY